MNALPRPSCSKDSSSQPESDRLDQADLHADTSSRACLASILRIVALGDLKQTDLTYSGASTYMWSQIEPSAAILCACFVTYRPLFRDLRVRNIFSSFSRKSASKDESGVSRRYPTNVASDMASEEGLAEGKGGMGFGGGIREITW
ncbi:MAG: hypothetical protein Q9207_001544 [Kuettlingeria erythrocarpa]